MRIRSIILNVPMGAFVCLLSGLAVHPAYAEITYDFDDGTLQGWTSVMEGDFLDRGDDPPTSQTAGIFRFDVVANSEPLSGNSANDADSMLPGSFFEANRDISQAGNYRIMPSLYYQRDDNPNTLLLRSPEFTLDGSGDLTVWLLAGDIDNDAPATSADLSDATVENGFQGVALRRIRDDAYVLFDGKLNSGATWQQIVFTQAMLAEYALATEAYTLDLIDYSSGGWGWVGMDTVSIPGEEGPAGISGDINLSGDVDRQDVALFTEHFGLRANSIFTTGDFDNDGKTGLADLALLQQHFGESAPDGPPVVVPEPSALGLLLLAMACGNLFVRRMHC